MPSTVLVTDGAGLHAVLPSPLTRVVARWRGPALDVRLASGVPPESSVRLAVRAAQLVSPRSRAALARDWRALADRAARPRRGRAGVPIARAAVIDAAAVIAELATRLTRPGPLPARGVAAARLLLTDGAGPVYRASGDLPMAVHRVLDELADPAPAEHPS